MAIQNQGYRRDLNLSETTDDEKALDNLMGTGISNDLRYLQNNLRNIAKIPFNYVDSNGFFSFDVSKNLPISSISAKQVGTQNKTRITIVLTNPYLLKSGNLVSLEGISGSTQLESLNGQYSVITVSVDLKTIFLDKNKTNPPIVNPSIPIGGVTFKHESENIFTFTKDDVVNVSVATTFTVGAATTTLSNNTDYYVTQSNGVNKFKLSKTSFTSIVGFTTITIAGNATADTPSGSGEFEFVRKDPVHRQQLINFIYPEIQDADGDFSYLTGGTINETFDGTQSNIESAEYFSIKKYRGDRTFLETDESINFEGSVVLNDPSNYIFGNGVGSTASPGIYIGDTRAFSSDNNPWDKEGVGGTVGAALTTSSEEVSIGQLSFLDGTTLDATQDGSMMIEGIDTTNDMTELDPAISADTFTHKIPVKIEDANGNQESYFLLLSNT